LDEITVCAPTRVSELNEGAIRTYDLTPEQLLGRRAQPEALRGGNAATNAEITRRILAGEKGPPRDVVVVNAAAALVAAGACGEMAEGIGMAQAAIDAGQAADKLEALIRYTQANG